MTRNLCIAARHASVISPWFLAHCVRPSTGTRSPQPSAMPPAKAFTVFRQVNVGLMGDGRTYGYVVALRAMVTSDDMTSDLAGLSYLQKKVSSRIINEIRGINR